MLCACLAMVAPPAVSFAQGTSVQIDIAPQPLSEALLKLAEQTSLQMFFSPDVVAGVSAPPVHGRMTPEQALDALLRDAPVTYRRDGNSITLSRKQQEITRLRPVTVTGHAMGLAPAYAGGQVATGGQVGLLGNKDVMDTPFSVTYYTEQTIRNQQASSVAEVLTVNDPSVRASVGSGNRYDALTIRGFRVDNDEIALNGLFGLVPAYRVGPDALERVELLKGASGLLNGIMPWGSVGGGVNVVTKRAGDTPLTRFTTEYSSDSRLGVHTDIGRRFGENNEFGIRFNGAYRDGNTEIDHQSARNKAASLGLDYTTGKVRLSADVLYQDDWMRSAARGYGVVPGINVPAAPDPRINLAQTFDYSDSQSLTGITRAEIDLTDNLMAFASVGGNQFDFEKREPPSITLLSESGDASSVSTYQRGKSRAISAEAGLRARLTTGPVQHQFVLSGNLLRQRNWLGQTQYDSYATNLYNPVMLSGPGAPISSTDVTKTGETRLQSVAVADTLSFLDDRVELTLGARRQQVQTKNFAPNGQETNYYNQSATTPSVALVVKPTEQISLYANYIEALTAGATPPPTAINADEVFAPYKSKQYEVGAKFDWGTLGASISAFQIKVPTGIVDPVTRVYSLDGEQRHQGIELNAFGELTKGVRLLGGVTLLDAKLKRTQDGANDGNHAMGAPAVQANLGLEWDTPFAPGLTLTGRAIHTGKAYISADNTQQIPSWTRYDLGARYTTHVQGKEVVLRANVTNVFDKRYWEANPGGYLTSGMPRTFWLSASMDF
jgi:iron complex outermembrane receptor protein